MLRPFRRHIFARALGMKRDPEAAGPLVRTAGLVLTVGSSLFAGHALLSASSGPAKSVKDVLAWHRGTGVLAPYDYEPTGTIVAPRATPAADASRPILYRLRQADAASAVLEGPPGRLLRVRPGMVLPRLGRVMAIEHRKAGWVVVTSSRTIE